MRVRSTRSIIATVFALLCACAYECGPTTTTPSRPPPKPTGPSKPRTPAGPVNPVVYVASRAHHSCAVRKAGDILCWGKNTYGQLGNGNRQDSPRLVKVAGVADATQVAVGRDFSCALRRTGTVVCWGNNEDGQLGNGQGLRPGALSLRPVAVAGLRGILQVSLGEYHGCAVDGRGTVRCWGNSGNGQIGSDRQRAFGTPLPIERLSSVRAVASGASHICALESTGTVKCWGRNTEGQLGDGKSGSRIKPVVVQRLEDAASLASGDNHTCAVRRTGGVVCWGDNKSGQLGPGAGRERKRNVPVSVAQVQGVAQLGGGGQHTCARLQSGRVVCWGANEAGQLGHTSSASSRSQPTPVRGVADATHLALGVAHTCAVRRNGEVACWGTTEYGALGPHRLAMRGALVDGPGGT